MRQITGGPAVVLALILVLATGGCGEGGEGSEWTAADKQAAGEEIAIIEMEKGGEIHIRFFPDLAPRHVENFKELARSGFYDGTTFHRVIPEFMIQGGDPNSKDDNPNNDGLGGSGRTLKAEFSGKAHRRGIVSMARAQSPDSASSQFFIMVADRPPNRLDWSDVLDGRYSIFGEVISGMDVVDRIVAVERNPRNRPLEDQVMKSVRIEKVPE